MPLARLCSPWRGGLGREFGDRGEEPERTVEEAGLDSETVQEEEKQRVDRSVLERSVEQREERAEHVDKRLDTVREGAGRRRHGEMGVLLLETLQRGERTADEHVPLNEHDQNAVAERQTLRSHRRRQIHEGQRHDRALNPTQFVSIETRRDRQHAGRAAVFAQKRQSQREGECGGLATHQVGEQRQQRDRLVARMQRAIQKRLVQQGRKEQTVQQSVNVSALHAASGFKRMQRGLKRSQLLPGDLRHGEQREQRLDRCLNFSEEPDHRAGALTSELRGKLSDGAENRGHIIA